MTTKIHPSPVSPIDARCNALELLNNVTKAASRARFLLGQLPRAAYSDPLSAATGESAFRILNKAVGDEMAVTGALITLSEMTKEK